MVTQPRLLLLSVAALWACGDGGTEPTAPPPDPPRPTTVTVSPATAQLPALGATVQLSTQVLDQNGQAMTSASVTWSSSDATVATVGASGLVTAVVKGTVTITATVGDASGTSEITVVESPDRATLVAFYEATDGPNWVNNENWLTDAPLGDWYGVDMDASGRVVGIDLAGEFRTPHGLTGLIPPELGSLANLRYLNLGDNDLTGQVPPELGQLANLTDLSLYSNDLTGPIPPELGSLADLAELHLGFNDLTGPIPTELGDLTSLRELGSPTTA